MHICLLDIDGTLILTGGAGQTAFAQTLAHEFDIPEITEKVLFAGRSDRAIVTDLFRAHGVEPNEENWQRFRINYLSRLGDVLAQLRGHVLPGVDGLLTALSARGDVAIGLLTGNIRDGARCKLTHYDLWHWFQFGGFGDIHTDRCDIAAEALTAAKEHLNGSAGDHGEIIVIGDTQHDVTCGRSIGARCVAVATGHTTTDELGAARPDVLLETLADFEPVLGLLN
jgi:phosphoglycolate phosphatase-like HAD superfamily hydrolase